MSSKRLISSAHRLVLPATTFQVTFRVTFPTKIPSAETLTSLDSLKLSLSCPCLSKSSFLEHLDLFRDKDTAKEDAKLTESEPEPLQRVSSTLSTPPLDLSFQNTNSLSSLQEQPTNTPATAAEGDATKATVQMDNDDVDNCDKDGKYTLGYLQDNLNQMSDYNPLQGYSTLQVLQDFDPLLFEKFPYLRKAINEWYEILHLPKVYLDPSKKSGGIFKFRVPGSMTKSLAKHVGTRYLEWMNWELGGNDVPTQSTTFDRQSETVSSTAILVLINNYAVSYIQQDGTKKTVYAKDGWNLLDLAHSNNIELEGACEGSLACSTCHIVMQKEFYEKLEEPCDEENDMLDLAFGLTEISRLGCQVEMSKELDGMTVRIPSASRNIKQEKM
ncbi:hypothetical protein HDU77_005462 [Chytriomyces hyalinus]|nr:hypothetical protein HDU77_005462 [Chytriomyces hyalinus]